jgi:hypothetical protein
MKRRTFLKTSSALSLATIITPIGIFQRQKRVVAENTLQSNFKTPPNSAKPHTWWHWMNGNVSKKGITLDLEAMARVGIGGFQNFDAGTGIPKGPIEYLSPEWLELKKHAIREANRLGLEFTMHNCPGWSSTGGPWITPELAMQQVTWSELCIEGGRTLKVKLPQPLKKLDYYKDISVIAFRSLPGEIALTKIARKIKTNTGGIKFEQVTGQFSDGVKIEPATRDGEAFVQFDFIEPQEIQQLSFVTATYGNNKGSIIVKTSDDGKTFKEVATLTTGSPFGAPTGEISFTKNLDLFKTKYLQLVCDHARSFSQIRFSNVRRAEDWDKRANYSFNRSGAESVKELPAIQENDIINISEHLKEDGTIDWSAPKGDWTILRFGFTPLGTENRSAPDTGVGLECDKYNAAALEFHFNKMMDNLLPSLAKLTSHGKVGLLIDSYEVGMQNWTASFEKTFKERNGYDLAKYLPALTGRIVQNADTTNRFLWDFRRTQGDLMADNYYGKFTELCHKHKMISYCQPYDRGPMEEMQIGSRVDINVGEFWNNLSSIFQNNLTMRRTVKLSAAIAHTNGQRVVAAESFTGEPESSKWQEYPFGLKALGDKMFTQGLNRIVFHRFAHQPHPTAKPGMTMGPWGTHFDRTNTWWEQAHAWLQYISRCQHLLQEGNFVADLAYFTGEDAGIYTRVERTELNPAPPEGYDHDLINAETILSKAKVQNKRLVLPYGISYPILILQDYERMTLPFLQKLEQLVKEGLVAVGSRPRGTPSLRTQDETTFKKIADELWGDAESSIIDRTIGKGKIIWGKTLQVILEDLKISRDFGYTSKSGDAPINYIHRQSTGEDIFFLANQRRSVEDLVCEFRISNKQPEAWDPISGTTRPISIFSSESNRTIIPITLNENGSIFIVFKNATGKSKFRSLTKDKTPVFTIDGFKASRKSYPDVSNNFAIALWIKPENHVMLGINNLMDGQKPWTDNYAIYPSSGENLYGKGHATSGLAIGRNGVALWENSNGRPEFIFSVPKLISGWSHIVLAYSDGVPSLFIDGEFVQKGPKSQFTIHPGLGDVFIGEGASFYNGDMQKPELFPGAVSVDKIKSLASQKPNSSIGSKEAVKDLGSALVFFEDGPYELTTDSGNATAYNIEKPITVDLSASWTVSFPPDHGAPAELLLEKLVPLNEHFDHGVKYFSGTSTYTKRFSFRGMKKDGANRYYLDLGMVEVLADVTLNNKAFGILWARPFVVDVTDALVNGENELVVKVTNLWPNRLIGDEQVNEPYQYVPGGGGSGFASLSGGAIIELPEWYKKGLPKPKDGKVTFATWKHYHKDSPLLQSGLIGPVLLKAGVVKQLT